MEIQMRHLKQAVAEIGGVTVKQLDSKTRQQPIARYRQIIYWLANTRLGHTKASIGRNMGRDHTTITHGVCVVGEYPRHEGHRIANEVMNLAQDIAICEVPRFIRHKSKLEFQTNRKETT